MNDNYDIEAFERGEYRYYKRVRIPKGNGRYRLIYLVNYPFKIVLKELMPELETILLECDNT